MPTPYTRENDATPPTAFKVGQRVELHPATDAWMFGDQYGEVVKIGRKLVHVLMDRSGKTRRMHPANIGRVVQ